MKKSGKDSPMNFKLGREKTKSEFKPTLGARVPLEMKIRIMFLFPDEFFMLIRVPSLPQLLGSSKMSLCSTIGSNFFYCLISDSLHDSLMDFKIKIMGAPGWLG